MCVPWHAPDALTASTRSSDSQRATPSLQQTGWKRIRREKRPRNPHAVCNRLRLRFLEADGVSMEVNLRLSERLIRAVVGAVIVTIGLTFSSWWGGIGLVLLLTSLYGACPVYAFIGALTAGMRQKSKAHG